MGTKKDGQDVDLHNVSDATRAEEQQEAGMRADAGRAATEEEERAADRFRGLADDDVAEHERDMLERGARAKGEGKIV